MDCRRQHWPILQIEHGGSDCRAARPSKRDLHYTCDARRPLSQRSQLRHVIEATVGRVFSVETAALRGPSRGQAQVAQTRQIAMYLAHVACCLPLAEVGRLFGRDRTTVRHACAVVEDRRDDPSFDQVIGLLEQVVTRLARTSGIRFPNTGAQ